MTAVLSPSPSSSSSYSSLTHPSSPRSRRRECLGLVTSMRMSMDLSMKAVSVVLCCVMMTLPANSFNRGKRKPISGDVEPPHPHKRARTTPPSTSTSTSTTSEYFLCCHYRTLMIESDAELNDIKKAHRKMAVRYHPDKNQDASAADMFLRIQDAYETLSDSTKRRAYDTKMRHHIHQHHSTPLSCDETADQPACDMFGSTKRSSRRSRVARYFFTNHSSTSSSSSSSSSSLLPSAPLSSWLFMLLCASLFVLVVIPSFMIMLCSGVVLSLSTATYRYLRSSGKHVSATTSSSSSTTTTTS